MNFEIDPTKLELVRRPESVSNYTISLDTVSL